MTCFMLLMQWGHQFRPDYLLLPKSIQRFNAKTILALTATATAEVAQDICEAFRIKSDALIRTPFNRPNLYLSASATTTSDRDRVLVNMLTMHEPGKAELTNFNL